MSDPITAATLSTRGALIPVAHSHTFVVDSTAYGQEACGCGWKRDGFDAPTHEEHLIDALFASGAVVDAATLADDEALVERVADAQFVVGDDQDWQLAHTSAQTALRALAAALTERDS